MQPIQFVDILFSLNGLASEETVVPRQWGGQVFCNARDKLTPKGERQIEFALALAK